MNIPKYYSGNYIILDIKNFKIDRLYKKFIKLFNGPFEVFKVSNYIIKFKLPFNMKYNPIFYINIVKLFFLRLEGQEQGAKDIYTNYGRIIKYINDSEDIKE